MKVDTLLVDLDGTLLDARELPLRAEFIARSLAGLRPHGGMRKAWRALRSVRLAVESAAAEDRHLTNTQRASRALARELGVDAARAEAILLEEITTIFPKLRRHFYPVAGARDFLEWARPRYSLILATNPVWPLEQVRLRLQWAGVDPGIFASITHSSRMRSCKPSKSYFEELLEQEGLSADRCLMVGDDSKKDLPATKVGVPVFLLESRRAGRGPLSVPGMNAPARKGSYAELVTWLSEEGQ